MKTGVTSSDNLPGVATIGFFDGVHRGHRYLLEQVRQHAACRGLASVVVTFPVHPRKVMQPDFCPQLLTTCDEKLSLLNDTGIDACVMLDFTPQLAALSARQFMELLKKEYRIEALVIGYDHRFGHNRSEGFADYVRHGAELGMEVLPARAFYDAWGNGISSSHIRRLLQGGKVEEAAQCLGYDFFVQGTVVGGHRVGRTIGFPTANLRVDDADKLIPANGVYAVRVRLGGNEYEGKEYGGMLCIGNRPTLDNGTERSIEVHIFDFDADAYGHPMRLSFVRYTRPEQKFASLEALVARLQQDEMEIRKILKK